MATEIPDIRNLEKWEDAFQYPIPTTRAIEKRLRTSLNENHDKLRTLVGASYRDLLGTARTIIDIDGRLHEVEDLMRTTGRKTDSRQFDRIRGSYTDFNNERVEREQDRYAFASQLATLRSALDVVARLIKSKSSSLLSTKLLVLARVLLKSLGANHHALLETLGSKLGNLRQRLLKQLDKRLVKDGADVNQVVEDLTAFCLATSSSPSDALRHFYGLRLSAIQRPRQHHDMGVTECIQMRLELFIDTLRQVKSIFPDLLASSLRTLGSQSILGDEKLQQIEELKLDVHERWFGEDVRNYTPWTRHDDLQRNKAEQQLKSWTSGALDSLASSIEADIQTEEDIQTVVATRNQILQMWLTTRGTTRGLDAPDALTKLRSAFNQRCSTLATAAAHELMDSIKNSVVEKVANTDSLGQTQASESLWDISADTELLGNGGKLFREAIIHRRTGTTQAVSAVIVSYENCAQKLEAMHTAFKGMRETRWDDDYDDYDDSDDESSGASVHELLSQEDPNALLKELRERTTEVIRSLEPLFVAKPTSHPTSAGIFLLRGLRELRLRLPSLLTSLDSPASPNPFAQRTVNDLHRNLAEAAVEAVSPAHQAALARVPRTLHVRALWEGSPPLPLQIAPATFSFLRASTKHMEHLGVDLWNPEAVAEMKQRIGAMIIEHSRSQLEELVNERGIAYAGDEEPKQVLETKTPSDHPPRDDSQRNKDEDATSPTNDSDERQPENPNQNQDAASNDDDAAPKNGDSTDKPTQERDVQHEENPTFTTAPAEASASASKPPKLPTDNLIQLLFDTYYLHHALAPLPLAVAYTPQDAELAFRPLTEQLSEWSKIGEAGKARLQKSAKEYWRRTYLLFGLLCNG